MGVFTNWAYEIVHSLDDVGAFFARIYFLFPDELVNLLWLFPTLAVVMWMVRAFGHVATGGGE